jgi:phosphatidylglycerophosphatase A
VKKLFIKTVATGAGFGLSPIVPGTTGTIPGVIIAWLLFPLGWGIQVVSTLIALAVGVWVAGKAEAYYGHDGKPIVIDEVAGVMVSYLFVPVQWNYYLIGFVIFRILDIWKPYPARRWENLPSGWGIMGDDFAVGVYTNIALQMLVLFRIGL